jgi:hypothetical protein
MSGQPPFLKGSRGGAIKDLLSPVCWEAPESTTWRHFLRIKD